MPCECDLRHRRWNPNTGRCETCRCNFVDRRPPIPVANTEEELPPEADDTMELGEDVSELLLEE